MNVAAAAVLEPAPGALDDAVPPPSFEHRQTAHCESGVVAALLRARGCDLSEAMVFGLGRALAFAYIPLVRVNELPLISYRMPPRHIIRTLRRQLALPFRFERFGDVASSQARLRELLDGGRPVGLQASVFFLPYFPANMRFHFNGHNLIAYGHDGAGFLISDPVFERPARCGDADLARARFTGGALAPRGLLYYLDGDVPSIDVVPRLRPAIISVCRGMLQPLLPIVGVRGIRLLARQVRRLASHRDPDWARRYAGHIVRMQEEVGTGGAGFRFLYAAFLQEAARQLDDARIEKRATELAVVGDQWREFALSAARMSKGKRPFAPDQLADQLLALGQAEQQVFAALLQDARRAP